MTTSSAVEVDTWEFDLSIEKPLSLNDRENRFARNARVQKVREEAAMMTRIAGIPRNTMRKVRVTMTYLPPDKRRRDTDNLVATYKAICDGLVDAGVVADDTPAEMEKVMPIIGDVLRSEKGRPKRRFFVKVERLM